MPAIPEAMQRERYADECSAAGVLHEYEALIAAGNPPGFAAMLALQSPPGSRNTDRAFSQGQQHKMERMNPTVRKALLFKAKQAGINTDGKFYCGGLGRYENPVAWVSSAQDVVDSAKLQGLTVEGVISHKGTQKDIAPVPSVALAPDLVNQMAGKMLKADPALAEKCRKSKKARGELRERVIATHGRKRNKFST